MPFYGYVLIFVVAGIIGYLLAWMWDADWDLSGEDIDLDDEEV